MALQWLVLSYVVAAEAAVAILVTLPTPKLLRDRLVYFVSLILQPALFIVPFAGFQLVDIYWKNEHRLMCTSDVCTAAERDRYEKSVSIFFCEICCLGLSSALLSCEHFHCMPDRNCFNPLFPIVAMQMIIYKAQRNVVLCIAACFLYWSIYRICKYQKDLKNLEEVEKRYKSK
ncbi:hypothetical protein Ahy_A05g022730 isoform A [Arachis hypogaea]|uniref:Endoplasmic reticulum transmembrane protein n=1 Tax=Arachis hypogaea TaxID=3818 RepID=A0A445D188_ARAHY|nr:hypothetical protein Ahy_A05g022730 isoform A [Arachis hypogaea]